MEDDDLEFLRLAALKSLQSKKIQNKEKVGNAIKVVESINSVPSANAPYFPPVNHPSTGSRIQTLVHPNDNSTINEPYLPQRRDAITPWVEAEYGVPYGVAVPSSRTIIPNVQLSPRSAAFVSQNNDILNRRKGHAASPERDRSRSPITPPGRYTPGRWSVSPPPYKHVSLRPHYERRSGSRSPIRRDKTPQIYRRSPLPSSKSPPQASKKSRSPPPLKSRKSPLRKSMSRSPHRTGNDRHPSSPYTRNRSPTGRYLHSQKSYRRYSPTQSRSYNRKPLNTRRSQSPRNNGHHPIKRSKSPANNSKKSRSRSPNRNIASRSNRSERVNKRRSPLYNRKNNSNRSSNRSKRKLTPPQSPVNKKKVDNSQNSLQQSTDDKKTLPTEEKDKIEKTTDSEAIEKAEPASEKSTENVDNEGSASSDEDKSNDEDEDDRIDLFASEESESENEGRFKSNSSKNTRSNTVPTVSFSKLGNTTASALGELNELKSDKNSTSSHREDRYKRGSNYSNRKDDRSKKYGSSRSEDNRYGDSSRSNYKSRYMSTASAVPKVAEEKKKDDKSMFKSTFQVLPNEMKSEAVKSTSKPTVSSRVSPIKEKSGEKKLIVLKRPAESTVEDQMEEEPEKIPSAGDTAKKSIHARLGAPTKTWKNKKSWRTEKVSEIFYVNSFSLHYFVGQNFS